MEEEYEFGNCLGEERVLMLRGGEEWSRSGPYAWGCVEPNGHLVYFQQSDGSNPDPTSSVVTAICTQVEDDYHFSIWELTN